MLTAILRLDAKSMPSTEDAQIFVMKLLQAVVECSFYHACAARDWIPACAL